MANAASYRYDLGNSQVIYLSNQGSLTSVTFSSSAAGQQQQSSQAVSTGQWTAAPKLYALGGGYVATILAAQTFYLSMQGNQVQMSSGAVGDAIAQQISQLEPLPMQVAEPPSIPSMQPMNPMQPMTMTMGDMSMSPGEMRMGDMRLSTQLSQSTEGRSAEGQSSGRPKKYCSQCGAAVEGSDRFCAQCGNQLA